jgi:hypothetical protein
MAQLTKIYQKVDLVRFSQIYANLETSIDKSIYMSAFQQKIEKYMNTLMGCSTHNKFIK